MIFSFYIIFSSNLKSGIEGKKENKLLEVQISSSSYGYIIISIIHWKIGNIKGTTLPMVIEKEKYQVLKKLVFRNSGMMGKERKKKDITSSIYVSASLTIQNMADLYLNNYKMYTKKTTNN